MTWQQQTQQRSDKLRVLPEQIPQLPPRPDRLALSDSIPLFFVGRSQSGFWVARESEGLSGGLFFCLDVRRRVLRATKARPERAPLCLSSVSSSTCPTKAAASLS